MSNYLVELLSRLLKSYGIKITTHTIEQTILTHPEYPSMQCISDALDSWKVKHVIMKLTLEKLRALDIPVVAHLKKNEFVWVTQVTDSKVYLEDSFGKKISDDIETFEQEWSGIALAIEDIVDAGEPSYKEKYDKGLRKKIFEYTFMSSYMILLFALVYFSWMNDTAISILCKLILLFVNMTGCYIAYTLIKQEKFQINRLAQRFCKVGKHVDCFQVTRSNYSKFFGWLSWAELGIAYFSAVTLWVAIAPISSHWISPL